MGFKIELNRSSRLNHSQLTVFIALFMIIMTGKMFILSLVAKMPVVIKLGFEISDGF